MQSTTGTQLGKPRGEALDDGANYTRRAVAGACMVTYIWAIGRVQRNSEIHASNGNSAQASGSGEQNEGTLSGVRCQLEGTGAGSGADAPAQQQMGRAPAAGWNLVGSANAWETASKVVAGEINEAISMASSYQTAGVSPHTGHAGPAAGPGHPPRMRGTRADALEASSAVSGQCAAMLTRPARREEQPPAAASPAAGSTAAALPPASPAAGSSRQPLGSQDPASALPSPTGPPPSSATVHMAAGVLATAQGGEVPPPVQPALNPGPGGEWSNWPAAVQAWSERAAAAAAARAEPPRPAGSYGDWAGSELWCERRDGDLYCMLCNKFASDAHLQRRTRRSRMQDPTGWLQRQRADWSAQQRRAAAAQRAAAQSAVAPWLPPTPPAAPHQTVLPAPAEHDDGASFHVDIGFDILGRRDAWDETRMSFTTSPCIMSIQSQHTPACLAAGSPLLPLSSAPCFGTGDGTHLTIHFGGALRVCCASPIPEETDTWGGGRTPRAVEDVRLPRRAEPKAVPGVALVPNVREQMPRGQSDFAVNCSDLFPFARVFHGLDYPDTPPGAAVPTTAAERPVDGLRDSISLGVPAIRPGSTANVGRVAFHVQGHRVLRADWRQHATLGEMFLVAIRNEPDLNAALSIGIMGRLRYVIGGLHLMSTAKVLNYSGDADVVVYIAAVGGARGAETEPPSGSEGEDETLHYGAPYSLVEQSGASGSRGGMGRGEGAILDDPVLEGTPETQLEVRIHRSLEFRHAAAALLAGQDRSGEADPPRLHGSAQETPRPEPSATTGALLTTGPAQWAAPVPKATVLAQLAVHGGGLSAPVAVRAGGAVSSAGSSGVGPRTSGPGSACSGSDEGGHGPAEAQFGPAARTALTAAMHRYAEAVAASQVPPTPATGDARYTRLPTNDWNKQAEDYAQFLMLRPSVRVDDVAVVIMLSAIEAVKSRRNAAPDRAPVRSVALGLTWGHGEPVDSTMTCRYEWTIRLLNRYMRQAVLGYDGVAANFKWATIQLNAFYAKAHVDRTNTEHAHSVVMAFGDFEGGEFLVWENSWYSARPLPLDSCSYGVDVRNRAFHFNPFRPHGAGPCRGERRSVVFYHVGPAVMAASSVSSLLGNLGFALSGDPPAQADEVVVPMTGGRPHATAIRDALRLHPTGHLSQGASLAALALEYERERHGPRVAPDSAALAEKYRRVASALERCRVPGAPGQVAQLLPRADGAVSLAGRAFVRFIVPFLPVRGVAWAPVPIGHMFEESYGIRAPRDLSARLRFPPRKVEFTLTWTQNSRQQWALWIALYSCSHRRRLSQRPCPHSSRALAQHKSPVL